MASRVGKYLLFETLGEGAFGKVKLGVHEESGEQVAVKIMDKSDIKAQEMTMNVRREIAIMKALKHRNIVNLRQVLTSQSKLYIVMDLVTGGELFTKILNEGKLEETIARRYFQQLVDGIEYCHRRGVCHRDLKPENLLIDETTGELKITDFGLSAMKGASTTEELLHTQCGSPNYCAPEIIARHKEGYNGTKVDAWSCGIILFALLAGFLPFYDENTKVLYRMIQRDDVEFPRKFPPDAKDLVLRLLHKDPEKRYTLAEVKKHPWFAIDYEGDDAVPKTTTGASPPASRRRRRGHSRKSSVDHVPRSRELREMVPRKKSDKSDNDSGSGLPVPPIPPGGQPTPPPIVIDSAPRSVPLPPRPPAPPSVSPPPPRSPLPPLPPQPPATVTVVAQPLDPQPNVPLPPPPPPTMPPPPAAPYGSSPSARPAPPYHGIGTPTSTARRKSTEHREYSAGYGHTPGGDTSVSAPRENGNIASGGRTIPSYAALTESSPPVAEGLPMPPGPVDETNPPPVQTYSPPMTKSDGADSAHAPSGTPPPPPPTIPPANGPQMSTNPAPATLAPADPAPASASQTDEIRKGTTESHTASLSGTLGDPAFQSGETTERASLGTTGSASVSETNNAPPSPPINARKWTVSGPTRQSSYIAPAIAPVTTPSVLASGDASWMKRASKTSETQEDATAPGDASWMKRASKTSETQEDAVAPGDASWMKRTSKTSETQEDVVAPGDASWMKRTSNTSETRDDASRTVKFDVKETDETGREEPEVKPNSEKEQARPLSLVEQRRLLYESEMPPPLQDSSLKSSSFKSEGRSSTQSEPSSAPVQRFGDRVEAPKMSGYPTAGSVPENPQPHLSSSPTEHALPSDAHVGASQVQDSVATHALPESDEVVNEETTVEHVGDTMDRAVVGAGVTILESEDEEGAVPLKQRLTAALARYRRIFKLGNNIGITASPSFNSNRGSSISVGSGEDDKKSHGTNRAEFFARAKAITGAWGIILTQELDDDSDSEDDTQQVTEAELQAFSRLLDFWDNRRASATIPQGGEVLLDDENVSPLSEEDIASIQLMLQKLEPKQVEEEMTEVAEDAADLGVIDGIPEDMPSLTDNVDSLEDLDVENIQILPTGSARRSSEHSAPSDYSGVQSPSLDVDEGRRSSHMSSGKPAPVSPPPPPPPPMPAFGGTGMPRNVPPPPPPPAPRRPKAETVASWDRGAPGSAPSVPVPAPAPPLPPRRISNSQRGAMPPPPPPYAAPESAAPPPENQQPRMVVTQSTVRDPFRPRPPPSYPPPQSNGSGSVTFFDDAGETDPRVVMETNAAVQKGARIPQSISHDAGLHAVSKRKSSTTTAELDADGRKTVSRDSGRAYSAASASSDTPGSTKGRHYRSPSRDEHATRGMFAFGMFSRRKSSPLTSFDSELAPDRCLLEIGRILTAMECRVLMKRGESKMKCEAPLKQDKLLISITCTRERKVSTIHFKRGRKDRSQVDTKEFYEFFQKVHARFNEQVSSEVRAQK